MMNGIFNQSELRKFEILMAFWKILVKIYIQFANMRNKIPTF